MEASGPLLLVLFPPHLKLWAVGVFWFSLDLTKLTNSWEEDGTGRGHFYQIMEREMVSTWLFMVVIKLGPWLGKDLQHSSWYWHSLEGTHNPHIEWELLYQLVLFGTSTFFYSFRVSYMCIMNETWSYISQFPLQFFHIHQTLPNSMSSSFDNLLSPTSAHRKHWSDLAR